MPRNDWVLTEKGKAFSEWAKCGIALMQESRLNQRISCEIRNAMDEDDADIIESCVEHYQKIKAEIDARLVPYRLTILDLQKKIDYSGFEVRTKYDIERYITMRFMRGLPIDSRRTNETIVRRMGKYRRGIMQINAMACNLMAEHWDENTPPV